MNNWIIDVVQLRLECVIFVNDESLWDLRFDIAIHLIDMKRDRSSFSVELGDLLLQDLEEISSSAY